MLRLIHVEPAVASLCWWRRPYLRLWFKCHGGIEAGPVCPRARLRHASMVRQPARTHPPSSSMPPYIVRDRMAVVLLVSLVSVCGRAASCVWV